MSSTISWPDLTGLISTARSGGDAAVEQGPFFLGVFLVLLAVGLILLNKNRFISSFFAVCGILLMVWASLIYSGIGWTSLNAYNMKIDNIAENQRLVLTNFPPRLFRHHRVYDTAREAYSIDLLTVSTAKLEKGYKFPLILKEDVTLSKPDGTTEITSIDRNITIPFNGKLSSTYELRGVPGEDEEGLGDYELVNNVDVEAGPSRPKLLLSFLGVAFAGDAGIGNAVQGSSPHQLAQTSTGVANRIPYGSTDAAGDADRATVIYFRRSADEGKVSKALSTANIDYLIKDSTSRYPSNAVWVGVDVPPGLAERIGYSLLEYGLDLRHFGYFTNLDTKTNVVQIGYSRLNATKDNVTGGTIQAFVRELENRQGAAQTREIRQQQLSEFLTQQQQQRQLQRAANNGLGLWGIVFGGDKTHRAALDEIARAKNAGHSEAQIYLRKNMFRSVVPFRDEKSADSSLPSLVGISRNHDAYKIDMQKWCQGPVLRQDEFGVYFECK